MILSVLYSVFMVIPFVPGAEIGLMLMAAPGPTIAIMVYVCTIAGLSPGFLAGRLIPVSILASVVDDLGLNHAGKRLRVIEAMTDRERMMLLVDKAPKRFVPDLLRYRYVALAIAINVPGNVIVGGGGGIALFAGVSRRFSLTGYLLTIAIAVAPIPLAVSLFGSEILSDL